MNEAKNQLKTLSGALQSIAFFIFAISLIGCEKQNISSSPKDRVGLINSTYGGSIDYPQAQLNLRNKEPYIINEQNQINYNNLGGGFSRINSDGTRSFTLGSPSDPNKLILEDVDCAEFKLRINSFSRTEKGDWFNAEADKVSGYLAYAACHLPSSQF